MPRRKHAAKRIMRHKFSSMLRSAFLVLLLLALCSTVRSQTVTNLHIFGAGATNGDRPYGSLIQAGDGNFYGTTRFGGSQSVGTVFRISPTGDYTNIYSFASTYTF